MSRWRWLPIFADGTAFDGALAGAPALLARGAPPAPLPSVEVTLHRFDIRPGQEGRFDEWIAYLQAHHREAVATLQRERMYFEAMFRASDEPRRLFWITVQGAGGATVESSDAELDRRHTADMDEVLAKGSHARLITRNVLASDFIVATVAREQRRATHPAANCH